MSNEKAITPVEQRQIEFYEDKVTAVLAPDGTVYVPMKPLCELIGLNWSGQQQRIQRDEILSDVSGICVTHTPQGGKQEMVCLPLDYLNGWLFGVNASRVKSEIKPALLRYQRDCYRVLFEAFSKSEVTTRPDDALMQSDEPSAVSFRTLMQMAKLARETYYLTQQVQEHETRIGVLEAKLGESDRFVSEGQAQQIATAVKAIALKLGETSQKNEFGGVYGALYAKFGITSYKRRPAAPQPVSQSFNTPCASLSVPLKCVQLCDE